MKPLRLALASAAVLAAAGAVTTGASAAPATSGCGLIRDAAGDTAADAGAGAPATVPQADPALDITALDVASNRRWIGARVHVVKLGATADRQGGEGFAVSMQFAQGALQLGVGRYANATGIAGEDTYAYAGVQQKDYPGPRDVPARAVALKVNPFDSTFEVYVARSALRDIGFVPTGAAHSITVGSVRQYGDEIGVAYDAASGPATYPLNAPSCLRLPS